MEGGVLADRLHAGLSSYLIDREFQATPKTSPGKKESSRGVLDLVALRIILDNLEESASSGSSTEEEEEEEPSQGKMEVTASLRVVLDKLRESISPRTSPNTSPEKEGRDKPDLLGEPMAAVAEVVKMVQSDHGESLPEIKYDERGRKLKLVSKKDIDCFKLRRQRPPIRPVDHDLIDRVKNDKLREDARRNLVAAYEARLRMRATEEDIMRQYDIYGYAYFEVLEK